MRWTTRRPAQAVDAHRAPAHLSYASTSKRHRARERRALSAAGRLADEARVGDAADEKRDVSTHCAPRLRRFFSIARWTFLFCTSRDLPQLRLRHVTPGQVHRQAQPPLVDDHTLASRLYSNNFERKPVRVLQNEHFVARQYGSTANLFLHDDVLPAHFGPIEVSHRSAPAPSP